MDPMYIEAIQRNRRVDLGEPKIILYNLQYRKYMIHGIEDYMYNLDLEGKSVVWIEAPMLVCRNNVRNEELQTISNQEELVREVFTRRRGLNLLYLKKGMCLLDQTVVAAAGVAEDIPLWKNICSRRWKCMHCNIITGKL